MRWPAPRPSFTPVFAATLGAAVGLLVASGAVGATTAPADVQVVETWSPAPNVDSDVPTHLTVIAQDDRLRLVMHRPTVVMGNGGWQPFLFCSAQGTLFCQSQINAHPFQTKAKKVYHDRIATVVSRDGGATWSRWTYQENHDDVYMEGGAGQCADGTILMFDTYLMPSARVDHGIGELWKSTDDLHSLTGPSFVDVYLPHVNWTGSSDDGGHPHHALRMHRSLLELPNRDLLATVYGWLADDHAPCPYMPSMKKTRAMVIRSRDRGASWSYLATVAVDGAVGTEGFDEPCLIRISRGVHAGRLLCFMRTGRDLYGAHSDDDGVTWSRARAVAFPGIDIYDTARWVRFFANPDAPGYVPSDQLLGAMVDPDLTPMRDGTLVCTVGVRTPEKLYTRDCRSPVDGDYLAFSCDGGDTWSEVVQFLSGSPTTQYMGVREVEPGVLYVVYDDTIWKAVGRTMGFRLEVARTDQRGRGAADEPR